MGSLIQRKKKIMMMQEIELPDLYPIGTDVYDGVLFQVNKRFDGNTGEVVDGAYAVSDFIEVNVRYEYTRSYRLYGVANYDSNFNFLGYQSGFNDLSSSVINRFITGTKYIRTMVHNAYINTNTGYNTTASSWLKRTA